MQKVFCIWRRCTSSGKREVLPKAAKLVSLNDTVSHSPLHKLTIEKQKGICSMEKFALGSFLGIILFVLLLKVMLALFLISAGAMIIYLIFHWVYIYYTERKARG